MTYEQIAEMVEEMGLPFAYHHFAEGESPTPPFLLFFFLQETGRRQMPYCNPVSSFFIIPHLI